MLYNALGVISVAAAVWVIYEVFTENKKLSTEMKIVWTVLALLFGVFTAIAYYFMHKR